MSFKRHDVQEFIEYDLGCLDLNNWKSHKSGLQAYTVDNTKRIHLESCIKSDTLSYFYKSMYSYVQALSNINKNNYNWSIVQLYYSCFYAIRADILLSNHCIVRCGGLFMVENKTGEQFQSITMNARGDHQMAIALLRKLKNEHKLADDILDVDLEGTDAYSWLMKHRERSNYQMKNFIDPEIDVLFHHLNDYFKTKKLFDLFDFYSQSDYSICFDLDHSVLSIPFKKIMQIKEKIIATHGLNVSENIKQYIYLKGRLAELGLTKSNVKNFI